MLRVGNSCGLGTHKFTLVPSRTKMSLDWGHAWSTASEGLDEIWMAQGVTHTGPTALRFGPEKENTAHGLH